MSVTPTSRTLVGSTWAAGVGDEMGVAVGVAAAPVGVAVAPASGVPVGPGVAVAAGVGVASPPHATITAKVMRQTPMMNDFALVIANNGDLLPVFFEEMRVLKLSSKPSTGVGLVSHLEPVDIKHHTRLSETAPYFSTAFWRLSIEDNSR